MWDYWFMSTTRCNIITMRCRLHGTSTTAFHRQADLRIITDTHRDRETDTWDEITIRDVVDQSLDAAVNNLSPIYSA